MARKPQIIVTLVVTTSDPKPPTRKAVRELILNRLERLPVGVTAKVRSVDMQ